MAHVDKKTNGKALVVFSGGQDSTTCLYWALREFGAGNVHAICFDYGQRHSIEIESAKCIAEMTKVPMVVVPINTFSTLGGNSLVDHADADTAVESSDEFADRRQLESAKSNEADSKDKANSENHKSAETLPNTFVPGRNLIFLTFAAAHAWSMGCENLIGGMCETDYSGYPDCRRETIDALEISINLGMGASFTIHTPLMHLDKAASVVLAKEVGAFEALAQSHTCYNGSFPPCGTCPACELRRKGFEQAGEVDPLIARAEQ